MGHVGDAKEVEVGRLFRAYLSRAGQTALLCWGRTAAVPLPVEHSQISDLGTEINFCYTIDPL